MVYSDQPSHSSLITYTSAHSGSIMKDALHSFVAKNEPTQQLAYEDFEQSDFADHAGNAAGSVYDAAVEFAMMGISTKDKIKNKEWEVKLTESLARTKLGLGFKEYIRSDEVVDLSIPSVFDPEPENREVKSLYERFVKAAKMHEVPPSITGTFMPTSYKYDLEETHVTFGSKSNTSSINTSESNDFVSCDNSDKSSESKTYVSSPKTNDSFSTVDVKILPKSDVKDLSPTNGFPSCSFKENVKPPRNLYNFPSVVSKAASVPAGSTNSLASISTVRSIPAASRNIPTSIHAGRHIPAGIVDSGCLIPSKPLMLLVVQVFLLVVLVHADGLVSAGSCTIPTGSYSFMLLDWFVTQNWMVITFHVPFWNEKWLVQGGTAVELASPEQMATGKDVSNPFMAVMVCQKPLGYFNSPMIYVPRARVVIHPPR
nr:ribonuclease H-like domain, reverse transcriptase, RNA-dependent DNA polymerase [Tanacetum cinerariifolium]